MGGTTVRQSIVRNSTLPTQFKGTQVKQELATAGASGSVVAGGTSVRQSIYRSSVAPVAYGGTQVRQQVVNPNVNTLNTVTGGTSVSQQIVGQTSVGPTQYGMGAVHKEISGGVSYARMINGGVSVTNTLQTQERTTVRPVITGETKILPAIFGGVTTASGVAGVETNQQTFSAAGASGVAGVELNQPVFSAANATFGNAAGAESLYNVAGAGATSYGAQGIKTSVTNVNYANTFGATSYNQYGATGGANVYGASSAVGGVASNVGGTSNALAGSNFSLGSGQAIVRDTGVHMSGGVQGSGKRLIDESSIPLVESIKA